MARKTRTRSAADIARKRARSGRSSLKKQPEKKRKNRRKSEGRKKARNKASSPPRRTRKKRKKTLSKGNISRTRSLGGRRRRGGIGRLFLMVCLMMGLGFGLVWGLDAWARLSRPEPSAPSATQAPPVERPAEGDPATLGLGQLWDKFVDRLLDRDLPVKRRPTLMPKKPKPKPVAQKPAPQPSKPDPTGRSETRAPPAPTYQAEAKPLEEAVERKVKKASNRRARLDAILDRVGVEARQ